MAAEWMYLVGGLALLWWAGDKTVRYALEVADLLGIQSFVMGFVIVSVSTGLPEIATTVFAVLSDAEALSAGNILGSSFVNLSLVLGAAGVAAGTIALEEEHEAALVKTLALITVLSSLFLVAAELTVAHGVALLAAYAAAIWFLKRSGLMERVVVEEREEAEEELEKADVWRGLWGTGVKLAGSIALLLVGGRFVVDGSIGLAELYSLPLESVGATLVAVGTGLPELSIELHAVRRGEYALALGDIFGSTLVNMSLILGLLSVISPAPVETLPLLSIVIYMGLALVLVWDALLRNHGLDKRYGYALLLLFVFYLLEEAGVARIVGIIT
jgi:cation:H+ antiporter